MLLYEVQVRPLLHQIGTAMGRPATLLDIPHSSLAQWRELGFDYVWFMGVWPTTAAARTIALQYWREHWRREIPSREEDVVGSPYAIDRYIPTEMTLAELQTFSERVMGYGMVPIYDFVPNHFGVECELARKMPDIFVQSPERRDGTLAVETGAGLRHLAHGKDPYFAPWSDTLQIDYRSRKAREVMCGIGRELALACPGLRCDMSMLLIDEIFHETWRDYPSPADAGRGEFWREFHAAFREEQSITIAEAYWDKEEELVGLGFDYSYNKRVYDYISRREPAELIEFLLSKPVSFFEQGVTFLENHDEPRVASSLALGEHKMAAFLLIALPGLVMLHDGQLEGRKKFARIQLRVWPEEEVDLAVASYYLRLLQFRKGLKRGGVNFVRPKVLPGGANATECIAIIWQGGGVIEAFVINAGVNAARVVVPLQDFLQGNPQAPRLLFSTEEQPAGHSLQGHNLVCELPAHSGICAQIQRA